MLLLLFSFLALPIIILFSFSPPNCFFWLVAHQIWPSARNHRGFHPCDGYAFPLDPHYQPHCCGGMSSMIGYFLDGSVMPSQTVQMYEHRSHDACPPAIGLDMSLDESKRRQKLITHLYYYTILYSICFLWYTPCVWTINIRDGQILI